MAERRRVGTAGAASRAPSAIAVGARVRCAGPVGPSVRVARRRSALCRRRDGRCSPVVASEAACLSAHT